MSLIYQSCRIFYRNHYHHHHHHHHYYYYYNYYYSVSHKTTKTLYFAKC